MTWWMLRARRRRARPRRRRGPRRRAGARVRHRPARPDDHRRRQRRRASRSAATTSTRAVSPVSTVPEVRARLLELQREIIARTAGGIVVEGRDIGSVVWPQAPRSRSTSPPTPPPGRPPGRRGGRLRRRTPPQESLLERDRIDSGRAAAPLVMADGAVHIDTTAYTLDEVVDLVVGLVEHRVRRMSVARTTRAAAHRQRSGSPDTFRLTRLRPTRSVGHPAALRRAGARRRARAGDAVR